MVAPSTRSGTRFPLALPRRKHNVSQDSLRAHLVGAIDTRANVPSAFAGGFLRLRHTLKSTNRTPTTMPMYMPVCESSESLFVVWNSAGSHLARQKQLFVPVQSPA